MNMKISVLIGSLNRAHVLRRCLESVLAQDYDDFEVIVLDDGSDNPEEYKELIHSLEDSRVQLIRSPKPLGVSGGRNKLMSYASGDVFFVIDDDAYFGDNDALSKTAKVFISMQEVGILACKVKNYGYTDRSHNVPFSKRVLGRTPFVIDKNCYVGYFVGTGHAIKKEVIESCGYYNPELFFGEEELDLSYRAISKGWKIYYNQSVVVYHFPQPSVVGRGRESLELYHHVKNRFYLAWRYLPCKYVLTYLAIWLSKYLVDGVRKRAIHLYLKGVIAGMCVLMKVPREPLGKDAVRYLQKNFGRLWY